MVQKLHASTLNISLQLSVCIYFKCWLFCNFLWFNQLDSMKEIKGSHNYSKTLCNIVTMLFLIK